MLENGRSSEGGVVSANAQDSLDQRERSETTARLLITCADQAGIVAAVSNFFYHHGANITALDQHSTDPEGGKFFMRLEFQTPRLDMPLDLLTSSFSSTVAQRYDMHWSLRAARDRRRIALLVSKHDHALMELLWRAAKGDLEGDVVMVVSNHAQLRERVAAFGVPFEHIEVKADRKDEAEAQLKALLLEQQIDLVVLARYMQILTGDFVNAYPNQIINIHHSFLPAFVGADPYRQAHEKGVKLIGATAHYVTEQLDMGPIIDQDIVRVSHRDDVATLRAKGRDIERTVLARAVQSHLQDKIIVDGNKTVVF